MRKVVLKKLHNIALVIALVAMPFVLLAQTDSLASSVEIDHIFNMSMEELMKVKIVSASRSEENAFDVPLSTFVLTASEIEYSGATSIPDALKMCPGVIVREISNGTYDVSLRGGVDGFPAYNYSFANTSILVMIDNRPVFSSLQGGTYWQNLPVGLAEIDRIEVVHGPSSPLYGPNAVSGVINIITKRPKDGGAYAHANVQVGNKATTSSVIAGQSFNEKFSAEFAANYDLRNRYDNLFYNSRTQTYVEIDSMTVGAVRAEQEARFPDLDQSLRKFGASLNFYYKQSEDVNFMLSGATNHSMALQPLNAGAQLSNYTNLSSNLVFNASIYDFTIQSSVLTGKQGLSGNKHVNDYDYINRDLYIDYNYTLVEDKLSIRPALSYQSAYANDKKYTIDKGLNGTFNNEGTINNMAGSVKIDAKPLPKLRLIVAGRYDKFNYPSKGVFSYQGIVNYKLNDKHLFRAVTGRSFNGSFLAPTYLNTVNTVSPASPASPSILLSLNGNRNLKLLNNTLYEVGYRAVFSKFVNLDIAFFSQQFEDFAFLILRNQNYDIGTNTVSFDYYHENLPLKVKQQGLTLALQTNLLNNKIQFRPNITIQQTEAENYSPYYNLKGAWDNQQLAYTLDGHKDSTTTISGTSTPRFFGGFNLIIKPIHQLTIDVSGYFYDAYVLHSGAEVSFATGAVVDQIASNIASKFTTNLTVTYAINSDLNAFVNIRNITNQKTPEGFGTDRLAAAYLVGISFGY